MLTWGLTRSTPLAPLIDPRVCPFPQLGQRVSPLRCVGSGLPLQGQKHGEVDS